jgi:dTDP-L-rhamnose 4-epimerase
VEYKNILITGGAGFIGRKLSIKLDKLGYKVTVLDNLSIQVHGENTTLNPEFNNSVHFIKGSVTVRSDWVKALKDIQVVIHLAAETGTGQSMYEIEKYTDVNIKGTSILLDILSNEKHCVQNMIVASSRSIYGEGKYECEEHGVVYPKMREGKYLSKGDFNTKCPMCNSNVNVLATDENSNIQPESIYAITKQVQEQMFLLIGKSLNISAVSLRFQNVYGPGQSLSNPYTGVLSIFSTIIKNGNDINIFEDGLESRDFIYVDDVVDSILLAMESDKANGQVFNVGSGKQTSVIDVANTLVDSYKSQSSILISGAYRIGDIRHNFADIRKISELLGFTPKIDFCEGIEMFVSWVNEQQVCEDNYIESISEMKKRGLFK